MFPKHIVRHSSLRLCWSVLIWSSSSLQLKGLGISFHNHDESNTSSQLLSDFKLVAHSGWQAGSLSLGAWSQAPTTGKSHCDLSSSAAGGLPNSSNAEKPEHQSLNLKCLAYLEELAFHCSKQLERCLGFGNCSWVVTSISELGRWQSTTLATWIWVQVQGYNSIENAAQGSCCNTQITGNLSTNLNVVLVLWVWVWQTESWAWDNNCWWIW